jgi:signal transduction histidine kinase
MRYKRTVMFESTPAASAVDADDSAQRLTALLRASPQTIARSSFDHLVSLAANVMQCEKAVVILSGSADPEQGDVAVGPVDVSVDSPLVSFVLRSNEVVVLSDVSADERFAGDPLVSPQGVIGYFASAPLIDSNGQRVGTLCVADRTPRKWLRSNETDAMDALAGAIVADMALDESRLEILIQNMELRRLNDLQAMKDDFVATVSHELRTPLTSITASLGLLEDGILGPLSDEVLDVLRVASTNSARLISLVDDLLDLESMESGAIELRLASTSVAELVDVAMNGVEGTAAKVGIALAREDRFEAGTRLDCDSDRIVQVLVNLLGNAIKFAKSGTTVTMRTEIVGHHHLVFSVVDWGEGIPESSVSRLFDPFWQDDSSASRRVGGTGLGLAISKKIVDQHQGRIEVDSTLGIGSTFRVVLPLKSA